jgi:hypothetical protein
MIYGWRRDENDILLFTSSFFEICKKGIFE